MDINLGLSADATGTADVITATYSPAPTLVDKKILFLRTTTTNATTTPTFSPNGLTARVITKDNGLPLVAGDIAGVVILQYDLANTRWELLTAKFDQDTTPNLETVITQGASTGGFPITSPDGNTSTTIANNSLDNFITGFALSVQNLISSTQALLSFTSAAVIGYLRANVTDTRLSWTNGTKTGSVIANVTKTEISHTDLINLSATSVTKNGVEIVDTFVLPLNSLAFNPGDNTTYYFSPSALVTTTATVVDISLGYAFTITGAVITVSGNSISGTTEDSTFQIRNVTAGTSSIVGTFKTNASTTTQTEATYTGLNIAIGASDTFCFQVDAPTFATNPTAIAIRGYLICEK